MVRRILYTVRTGLDGFAGSFLAMTAMIAIAGFSFPTLAQTVKAAGAACSTPDAAFWEQSSLCNGSTWQRPAFQFGAAILGCTATTAGLVQWTGTGLQVCDSVSWMDLTATGGSNNYLGNSVTTANPHRIGGMITGLFSDSATSVSVSIEATERMRVTNTDFTVSGDIKIDSIAKAYYIGANKILHQPANDTTSLAVGTSALSLQTGTDRYQTAIGYQALQKSTATAGSNTALGYQALRDNTYGYNNIAFGRSTLYRLTTATNNIGIGEGTLVGVVTGTGNIGIDIRSLYQVTSGSYNVCANEMSCYRLTTGVKNVGVSSNVLFNVISGTGNVSFGWGALATATGASSYSVGLTYNTYSHLGPTTGNNNIVIGKETARNTLRTGSYNILIGSASVDTPASDTSNWVNIGNLIYGTMTPVQLGFATASPQATLDINGYARLASNSSAPATCDASTLGAIARTSGGGLCICGNPGGSPAWARSSDGVTSCTW